MSTGVWARTARLTGGALLLAGALGLSGCNFFFVCQKASCTNNTTGTTAGSTGDYAYVANSTSGTGYLAAYEISTGSPIAIADSPYNLGFEPSSLVVVPGNALMFIASSVSPFGIYAYTILTNGSISINNSGNAEVNGLGAAEAMDVTPDGKYLFALTSTLVGVTLSEYTIGTNGALTLLASEASSLAAGNAAAVKVAPSGNFVVISLGTTGDEIFPLSSDQFTTGTTYTIVPNSTTVADFAATVDGNNNIYFARTGQIASYSATAAGSPTPITTSSTGNGDHSLVLSSTGAYLYAGNATDSTISGFSTSNGMLGVLSKSPYTAPTSVAAIAADNSGKYLIAAGYNSSGGVVEYSIAGNGALTASTTTENTGSGTTLLAVTH